MQERIGAEGGKERRGGSIYPSWQGKEGGVDAENIMRGGEGWGEVPPPLF